MIAIVDYGVGNLASLTGSLTSLGLANEVTRRPEKLASASHIILPGVGAFGDAMQKLRDTGLVPVLRAQAQKKPLLGICLGMQLLFEKSYEFGEHAGLGLLHGEVRPLGPDLAAAGYPGLKVPHMGWNRLDILRDDPLFAGTRPGEHVYYVHSFYAKRCAGATLATSSYGVPVTGVVRGGLVYGTQFHPEKSGDAGLRMLAAFAALSGERAGKL